MSAREALTRVLWSTDHDHSTDPGEVMLPGYQEKAEAVIREWLPSLADDEDLVERLRRDWYSDTETVRSTFPSLSAALQDKVWP